MKKESKGERKEERGGGSRRGRGETIYRKGEEKGRMGRENKLFEADIHTVFFMWM